MGKPSTTQTQEEFLTAYDEYADAVFRFCVLKVNNREVAKDIMHDTFTKTWEYVAKGNAIENWRAFLFRTAHNLIIDYYRRKKSDSLDALTEDTGFTPVSEDTDAETAAEVARVHAALSKIPDEYRAPLQLRFVEGMQPKEIAEVLGLNVNVVSVRIHRGIAKLQDIINPQETV